MLSICCRKSEMQKAAKDEIKFFQQVKYFGKNDATHCQELNSNLHKVITMWCKMVEFRFRIIKAFDYKLLMQSCPIPYHNE